MQQPLLTVYDILSWTFLKFRSDSTFLPVAAFRITRMIHSFATTSINPGVRGRLHIPLATLSLLGVHATRPTTPSVSKPTQQGLNYSFATCVLERVIRDGATAGTWEVVRDITVGHCPIATSLGGGVVACSSTAPGSCHNTTKNIP